MLLLALACVDPVDTSTDTETTVPDTDATDTDTDTVCDPAVGTMPHPNFVNEALPTGAQQALDAAATIDTDQQNLVFVPAAATGSRLFVMLSDAGGTPADHERILGISAISGQRSIGLAWPSSVGDPAALCGADPACYDGYAEEILYGTDTSPLIEVGPGDAINTRLLAAIQAADASYPITGWTDYYSGDTLVYDKITVAGYGYGATLAAMYGRGNLLAGNVLFAGGCDVVTAEDGTTSFTESCTTSRLTSGDRMYGILHTKDAFETLSPIFPALGLDSSGDFVSADTYEPRYCTSTRMLTTSLPDEQQGTEYHLAVAHDDWMSVNDAGMPLDANDYWYLVTLADR